MTPEDTGALARLFFAVFRAGKRTPTPEFEAYFQRLFFESPNYDANIASVVQEDAQGRIIAFMGFLPVPLVACGREITARLGSAFMAAPDAAPGAAGRITAPLRARKQDFVFSNNGALVTAQATRLGGGQVLPLQSLDWYRSFRPLAAFLDARLAPPSTPPSPLAPLALRIARPVDSLLRRVWRSLSAQAVNSVRVVPVDRETVLDHAPAMVARFAVRPRWQRDELAWLLDMAALKQASGPLHQVGMMDETGHLLGIALYYARPGGAVELLNILCQPAAEHDVLAALLHHLDAQGQISVRGEAQPFLMPALFLERGVRLKFRGNFCVLTRHADVAAAVASGDFYAGGLVGESWSRLVTDFW